MYMKEGTREKDEKVKPSPSPEEQLVGTLRDVAGLLVAPSKGRNASKREERRRRLGSRGEEREKLLEEKRELLVV